MDVKNTTTNRPDTAETSSSDRGVLIVDDERNARETLSALLEDEGYRVETAPDGFEALGELREAAYDCVVTDLRMPVMDGLELIEKVDEEFPEVPVVAMTAFESVDSAVDVIKAGAEDYLTKPLTIEAVEMVVDQAIEKAEMRRELAELRAEREEGEETEMVGDSAPMRNLRQTIDQVAASRATVLITGESGTGKELAARRLHRKSDRAEAPFVQLHCSALSKSLLESELFGHEKGAFTGADEQRQGRFEYADGGTLFLDEIGEISESTQVKLLRFLQQREFERVGGNETIEVDVRIVAATNQDLEQLVKDGGFREDLYYRLDVVRLETPPLRARRADIPDLVRHFVSKYAAENDKEIDDIDPEVIDRMKSYDWPGNVRELENVVQRSVVVCPGRTLESHHLPDDFDESSFALGREVRIPGSSLEELERYAILETYEACGGNTKATAEILEISARKVQYKLKEYREQGLDVPTEEA